MVVKNYFVISLLLFLPLFGHDHDNRVLNYNGKPTPKEIMEVYAHRAGRGLVPENTLYACESSLRLGVDYLDFDIGMTKDGVIVVTHDVSLNPDITRDASGNFIQEAIPIYSLTFSEIQTYDVGRINPQTKYAALFPMQTQLEKAKIPSLIQAIEHVKRIAGEKVGFQIEIKTDHECPENTASAEEFAAALYHILREADVLGQTEVQAFNFEYLKSLQKLDLTIKTTYLTPPQTVYPLSGWHSILHQIKAMGGSCWGPYEMDVTKEKIQEAHQLGIKVITWGFPEYDGMEFNHTQIIKLINWGIDGIITDRPDILRGILSAKGYNLPKGFYLHEKT